MAFRLPKLPYARDALAPTISKETMDYHYGKHHAAYVKKLNGFVEKRPYKNKALEEVIRLAHEREDKGVFNNAAQVWNHTFFWHSMSPNGGGKPKGEIAREIDNSFGSYAKFKDAFIEAGTGQFGSGWVWLVRDGDKLSVMNTANADLPLIHGKQAILTCDVWEHAYYLDYQNKRDSFLKAFLSKLVNWDYANEQFDMQGEGNRAAARKYQKEQQKFAASGKAKPKARAAAEALAGKEGKKLEKARKSTAKGRTKKK